MLFSEIGLNIISHLHYVTANYQVLWRITCSVRVLGEETLRVYRHEFSYSWEERESHISLSWFCGSSILPVVDLEFGDGGKIRVPKEKPMEEGENQQQIHHVAPAGIKLGPRWWKASARATGQNLLSTVIDFYSHLWFMWLITLAESYAALISINLYLPFAPEFLSDRQPLKLDTICWTPTSS